MSDSVQPQRWQPIRLLCPWDSPGKNTGVGCHFLLQCMKVKSESEVAHSSPTLNGPMDCRLPGFSIHGVFQARVLEWVAMGIFSNQGSNPGLLHCRQILYHLSQQGSPLFLSPSLFIYLLSICVSIIYLREGNGTPLQYSCLENPWTEEAGRLQSMGSQRVGHD